MNAGLPFLGGHHDHPEAAGVAVHVPDVELGFADVGYSKHD